MQTDDDAAPAMQLGRVLLVDGNGQEWGNIQGEFTIEHWSEESTLEVTLPVRRET